MAALRILRVVARVRVGVAVGVVAYSVDVKLFPVWIITASSASVPPRHRGDRNRLRRSITSSRRMCWPKLTPLRVRAPGLRPSPTTASATLRCASCPPRRLPGAILLSTVRFTKRPPALVASGGRYVGRSLRQPVQSGAVSFRMASTVALYAARYRSSASPWYSSASTATSIASSRRTAAS